eukprot:g12889.t2
MRSKSGCFTLPALVERHWHQNHAPSSGFAPVALVISPLVSLMHDQVQRLRQHGIPAVVCSPQGGEASWPQVLESVNRGALMVFMSPERAVKEAKLQTLRQLQRVSLVAIDEAHCVSEWGHDFRAEYNQLSLVIAALDGTGRSGRTPPVLALTATCKSEVRDDVVRSLALNGAEHIIGSMNRPTLGGAGMLRRVRELFAAEGQTEAAVAERRARPVDTASVSPYSPTIIYCIRKRDADHVAQQLQRGMGVLVCLKDVSYWVYKAFCPCALLVLMVPPLRAASVFLLFGCAEASFGDELFENALVYANRSLHGNFVRQMVNGTLSEVAFNYYLHQDNLYLSKYARAFGVMGAKADRTDELAWLLNKSDT